MKSYIYMTKEGKFVKFVESRSSGWSNEFKVELRLVSDINQATVFGLLGERFLTQRNHKSFRDNISYCEKNCISVEATLQLYRKVFLKVNEEMKNV